MKVSEFMKGKGNYGRSDDGLRSLMRNWSSEMICSYSSLLGGVFAVKGKVKNFYFVCLNERIASLSPYGYTIFRLQEDMFMELISNAELIIYDEELYKDMKNRLTLNAI